MAHGALTDERGEEVLQCDVDCGISGVRSTPSELCQQLPTGCSEGRPHVRERLPLTEERGQRRGLQHPLVLLLVERAEDEAEELVHSQVTGGAEMGGLEGDVMRGKGVDGLRVADGDGRGVDEDGHVVTSRSVARTGAALGQRGGGEAADDDEKAEEKAGSGGRWE